MFLGGTKHLPIDLTDSRCRKDQPSPIHIRCFEVAFMDLHRDLTQIIVNARRNNRDERAGRNEPARLGSGDTSAADNQNIDSIDIEHHRVDHVLRLINPNKVDQLSQVLLEHLPMTSTDTATSVASHASIDIVGPPPGLDGAGLDSSDLAIAGLAEAAERLTSASPAEIVAWAFEEFGGGLVTTASFEDAVLVHLVAKHAPGTDVVLLDTQYLFAETWWYAERVTRRLNIPLLVESPAPEVVPDDRWEYDAEGCCAVRKVEPLKRTLTGRAAWLTGIRRADGPSRADAPVLEWDEKRQLVKVNPVVMLSDEDMEEYEVSHNLPRHPLKDKGYPSIGCWPCTRPVAPGEDKRAGRWAGQAKTECGLHS